MIDLNWINNFGPNGYGICGRQYAEILHKMGYKVKITPVPWMDPTDVLQFLTKTKVENPLQVWHAIPTHPQKCFYTVTEVKKPPDYMSYALEQAEMIMTQSEFCKESFSRITNSEKIHVVNFPFIGDVFTPLGPAAGLKTDKDYSFKFFTVARVDVRKNLTMLMEAFKEEFSGDHDVALVMKMGSDRYCIPKIFYNLELPKNILWMRDFVPDPSMLYRSVSAYVTTDCGEGWGAPTTEAMLCGIPTIAPKHSGHLDYMDKDNSYQIDVGDWEYIGWDTKKKYGLENLYMDLLSPQLEWKVPDFEDVKMKMRECYEKYKDMTRLEVISDQMIQNALKVHEITSEEYVGNQLKTALDWYENEYR